MLSPVLPVCFSSWNIFRTSWDIWDINWCFATRTTWWIHLQKRWILSNGVKLRGILGAVFVSLFMVLYQAMCFPSVHNSLGFHLAPDTNPLREKDMVSLCFNFKWLNFLQSATFQNDDDAFSRSGTDPGGRSTHCTPGILWGAWQVERRVEENAKQSWSC